jgi:hypothetical protein
MFMRYLGGGVGHLSLPKTSDGDMDVMDFDEPNDEAGETATPMQGVHFDSPQGVMQTGDGLGRSKDDAFDYEGDGEGGLGDETESEDSSDPSSDSETDSNSESDADPEDGEDADEYDKGYGEL